MKNKRPSTGHKNKRFYNWLVYKTGDKFLTKDSDKINGTVYDFGCGEKPYQEYFLQFCNEYIGVDWSETKHLLKADIIADLNKTLPIKNNVADTIVSFSVLEHLSQPEIMLDEAYRLLKSNGNFLMRVPFMYQVHEEPIDYFRYTKYGLKYMLHKAGFVNITISPTTRFWTTIMVKINYQLIRLIKGGKIKRTIIMSLIKPITYVNQWLAIFLDKIWYTTDKETLAYWVVAQKK
ncbi:MAG: class I SAM-dependent methyltransferase [Bacteroidales bacterium]|nr:class I SAM-dependent methyltransferase [Bacteroidales bacterium]